MTVAMVLWVIFISGLSSILMGRFYLNRQYHESNSGYRQGKIMEATKEMLAASSSGISLSNDLLLTRHRNSLGAVIVRFLPSFGAGKGENLSGTFPLFWDRGETDGFVFYDSYVKPVMYDLNNNAFIGWVPWILNVKRMRTLWFITHLLEEVIIEQEALRTYETGGKFTIFHQETDYILTVRKTNDEKIDQQIDQYLNKMNSLKKYWLYWLTLL